MPEPTVSLRDDAGHIREVPESMAQKTIVAEGLTPATPEEVARFERYQKYQDPLEKLKGVGTALLRVPTLGLSDYAFEPEYLRELEEQMPALTAGVEIGGTIGAALLSGGGTLLGKAALKGAARGGLAGLSFKGAAALGEKAAVGVGRLGGGARLQGLARAVSRESAEGASFGLMQGNKQVATDADYERAASTIGRNIGYGALTGGAFGLGLGTAGIAARAVGTKVGKAAGAAFGKVRGWAPGPSDALGDILESSFKRIEKSRGIDLTPARVATRDDEMLRVVLAKAVAEKSRAVDDLVVNFNVAIRSADDLSHLSRMEIKPDITAKLIGETSPEVTAAAIKQSNDLIFGIRAALDGGDSKNINVGFGNWLKEGGFEINDFAKKMDLGNKFWKRLSDGIADATSYQARRKLSKKYSQTAARAIALDSVKKMAFSRKVSSKIKIYMKAGGPEGVAAREINKKIYQPLREFLETEELFGNFAKWQEMSNASWVVLDGVQDHIGKLFIKLGKDPGTDFWTKLSEADRGAVERLVEAIGTGKGEVDSKIVRELARHWRLKSDAALYLKTHPDVGALVSPKTFEQAKKLREASDRILKALDDQDGKSLYSKIYASKKFDELAKSDERFLGGIPGSLAIGAGITTGSPLVYGIMRTAQAAGDLYVAPGRTIRSLGGLYLAAKKARSSDNTFVAKMLAGAKRAPGVVAKKARKVGLGARAGTNYALVGMTTDQSEYDVAVGALREAVADPDKTDEAIQDELSLRGTPADLKMLVLAKRGLIREYLLGMATTPSANDTLLGRARPVSRMEALSFKQVRHILENPGDAARLLEEGKFTTEQSKAMRAVWPSMYEDLQMTMMEKMVELGEQGKTIKYQKRVMIGTLLGLPTDPTLNYKLIQQLQIAYLEKQAPPQPPQQRRMPKLGRVAESESARTARGTE